MSRVTVVTGAGGGIGRALARAFAAEGDIVVLAARRMEMLEETRDLIAQEGGEALVVPTDVTDTDSVDALAETVSERLGRVDVLVNNSGVGGPSAPLWEADPSEWITTFDVNVHGVFLVTRALLPTMIEAGSGNVIVIGSVTGKRPLVGRTAYATTKMALVGLTRTLAVEAGSHNVRVNLISPGFVEGPRIDWVISRQAEARGITEDEVRREMMGLSPLEKLTSAEEVAAAAVYLASPGASAITGVDLNVNSGVAMY